MRQLIRLSLAAFGSVVVSGALAGPAAAAPKHKKPPSLDLCAIAAGPVASAEVSAPCVKLKTATVPVRHSPAGGTAGIVTYGARWGTASSGAVPQHYASITVIDLLGSGKGVEAFKKGYRSRVIGNGLPVVIAGATASILTEPNNCLNPPSGECAQGTFLAIKGRWVIEAFLDDYPPTIPGSMEDTPAEGEAAVMQTEQFMKPALTAIGRAVAAKV